jgi:hypothetical protein
MRDLVVCDRERLRPERVERLAVRPVAYRQPARLPQAAVDHHRSPHGREKMCASGVVHWAAG